MARKILGKLIPRGIVASMQNYKILSIKYGQYKTMRLWKCIDGGNNPIPWYTYPATEYIKQLDLSQKRVFEYGSGYSTLFWANRCKAIISVEDNEEWYKKIKMHLPENAEYLLVGDKEEYIRSINRGAEKFDIIIIDGSHRYECALMAREKLKDNGLIILDNSDWRGKTSRFLRESDLIEVDMSGFGPINGYTWTTSFYFTRKVKLEPAYERQPMHGIGSLKHMEV